MKLLSAALVLVLAFVLAMAAPPASAHPVKPLPAFAKPVPVPFHAAPPPEQAGNGAYWLLVDEQEDLPTHSGFVHYATRVLSEAGLQQASQISMDFDPDYQSVDWHRITLWRNGKPAELLPRLKATMMRREQEWEWGLLDGRQTQMFSLEDVRVGDVVEYSCTLRGENPIFKGMSSGRLFFRFQGPVARIAYRILHKPGQAVHLMARNGAPEARKGRAGDREEIAWSLDSVGAVMQDGDAPAWYDAYPRVQWGEYASWEQVVGWALDLYRVEGRLSPELEKVVARLRKLPPRERVRRALRLVQDDVRYLGLEMGASSHRPSHPDKVYARRFGDCKDKSLLFCSLMRRAGVDAAPVLVNSRTLHSVADFQPSPLAFDHVIARVDLDGKRYWFDPTMNHQRGDPLASQMLGYGKGLPIVPGGGDFDDIRPVPGGGGSVHVAQDFTLASFDSAAALEVVSTFTGAEADHIRSLFANDSRERIAGNYLNYYARAYPAIRAAGAMRYEDDSAANVVVVRESYQVDSLCPREEGRPGCSLYPQEMAPWVAEPDRRIRTSPYGLLYPKDVKQSITLTLPVDPGLEPDIRTVSHPDFVFSWSETSRGRTARLEYSYRALSDHVPLDRFPSYLAALDTVEGNLGITLYPEGGPSWSLRRPNQFMILFLLVSIGAGVWASRRLYAFAPASAPSPFAPDKPIGGIVLQLMAVGLIARPLVQGWYLWQMAFLLDQENWNTLTVAGGAGYHPLWAPLLLSDILGAVVLFLTGVTLIPLFFKRHRSFPKAFIACMIGSMVLVSLETFGFRLIPAHLRELEEAGAVDDWVRTMLLGAAWVAYVAQSARVRETFIHPRPVQPVPEEEMREKAAGGEPTAA